MTASDKVLTTALDAPVLGVTIAMLIIFLFLFIWFLNKIFKQFRELIMDRDKLVKGTLEESKEIALISSKIVGQEIVSGINNTLLLEIREMKSEYRDIFNRIHSRIDILAKAKEKTTLKGLLSKTK